MTRIPVVSESCTMRRRDHLRTWTISDDAMPAAFTDRQRIAFLRGWRDQQWAWRTESSMPLPPYTQPSLQKAWQAGLRYAREHYEDRAV